MTNDEFRKMYQEYNDELYHSWITSLDPVKRAAQQAKQKAYNAAYYLRNKAKWLKYNAKKNFQAHNENWGRGVDMIREGNRRLQSGIESRLNKLTGWNQGTSGIPMDQLKAREAAAMAKSRRTQAEFSSSPIGQARVRGNKRKRELELERQMKRRARRGADPRMNPFGSAAANASKATYKVNGHTVTKYFK